MKATWPCEEVRSHGGRQRPLQLVWVRGDAALLIAYAGTRAGHRFKRHLGDFPCVTVDKNPPANAGDTGSIPYAVEQLSPCASPTEPAL